VSADIVGAPRCKTGTWGTRVKYEEKASLQFRVDSSLGSEKYAIVGEGNPCATGRKEPEITHV